MLLEKLTHREVCYRSEQGKEDVTVRVVTVAAESCKWHMQQIDIIQIYHFEQ